MNDVESSLTGDTGQPTQSVPGSGVSGTSIGDIDKVVDVLLGSPKFQEALERRLQGQKDRRIAQQERKLGDFETKLARLEELTGKGLNKEQALWMMQVDDALASQQSNQVATHNQAGNQVKAEPTQSIPSDLPTLLGLDPNSPDVADVLRRGGGVTDLLELARKAKAPQGQSTPAQVLPVPGGETPGGSLQEQYAAEVKKVRGNIRAVSELQAKYMRLGLRNF